MTCGTDFRIDEAKPRLLFQSKVFGFAFPDREPFSLVMNCCPTRSSLPIEARRALPRSRLVRLLAMGPLLWFSGPALGRDLEMLADTLSGNFFAQQIRAICSIGDPTFDQQTTGPRGNADDYAAIVKREVTDGLEATELNFVISSAANRAKERARDLVAQFSRPQGQVRDAEVQNWCSTSGKAYVVRLEFLYDYRHADFERELKSAKQN